MQLVHLILHIKVHASLRIFLLFFLSHLSPLLISGEETQIPEPELGVGKIERPVVPLLTLQHQGATSFIHYLVLLSRLHYALFSSFFPIIIYVSKFFSFLFSSLLFFSVQQIGEELYLRLLEDIETLDSMVSPPDPERISVSTLCVCVRENISKCTVCVCVRERERE